MSNIKKRIAGNFWGKMAINKLHEIEGIIFPLLVSDEKAVVHFYRKNTGKKLNLSAPKTFSEKLNWYKLNDRNPLMAQCADKIGMRDYVEELGYGDCLNELFGVYTKVNDIDFASLPQQFVIKAAHGSHMNIIVKDKSQLNWNHAKLLMNSWLRQNIYWGGREWVYKDIPHRILIEKYLEDSSGDLCDYKIFCFNGIPHFMQVDVDRFGEKHIRNYYDLNWKLLDISDFVGSDKTVFVKKPDSFVKMLDMAQNLAKPFQFVRVDFYELNGKPYVGELTFFHNGGISRFGSEEWENIIGNYWKIEG